MGDKILQDEELVKKISESASQLGEPMTVDEFLEWPNKLEAIWLLSAIFKTLIQAL